MPLGMFGLVPVASAFGTAALVAGVAFLGVWIYAVVDARRTAKRIGDDYVLKDYNRWYVYVLLACLSLPLASATASYIRHGVMEAFKIPTRSMSPTILPGDRILVDKLAYRRGPVRKGDVVVFTNPNRRFQNQIKRVVALPGDTVEIRDFALVVNGTPVPRARVEPGAESGTGDGIFEETNDGAAYRVRVGEGEGGEERRNFGPLRVPNGHCFVLGDNRNLAEDSRHYGPVPLADIVGRVQRVFYPRWRSLAPERGE
jgi:signal peptidase I